MGFFSSTRFFLISILLMILSVGTGWFLKFKDNTEDLDIKRSIEWKLPDWNAPSITQDLQILKEKEFFGAKKQEITEDTPPPPPVDLNQGWRALGIVIEMNLNKVLIKNNQTGDVQSLKTGDKLPDGRIIADIQKDLFFVTSEKGQEEIRIFPFELKEGDKDIELNEDKHVE